jgi:hypothetical protein
MITGLVCHMTILPSPAVRCAALHQRQGRTRRSYRCRSLRRCLAGLPLPRAPDGRRVLAVDVSPWLRPDGNRSPQRSFCHTHGRDKDEHRMAPGWPYSIVAGLESGRTSWTALLGGVRPPMAADVTTMTCAQIGQLADRLTDAGQGAGCTRD